MDVIYELWDVEEAHPINEYTTLSAALAVVAATADRYGDGMVATWGLFRSTPIGVEAEVIAEGAALAQLARERAPAIPAAVER